jgi:hypothetical protein
LIHRIEAIHFEDLTMPVNTAVKQLTIKNNFGRTYIAVLKLSRIDSFTNEESFKSFLKKIKAEVELAKDSSLFDGHTTYVLGGFDVQVATAGLSDQDVIVTLGESLSTSMVEDIDPVKGFGVILSRMLNTYFDKQYVLSGDTKPGEVPYTICALQLDEFIIVDTFNEDFNKYQELQERKRVEGKSPLLNYGYNNSDTFWDYYYFDVMGDLVEVTFNVAQIMIESAVSPGLDFAEPAIKVIPDILLSTDAPIVDASSAADVSWLGEIGNWFGSLLDCCSAPDLNCDGTPDCDLSGCDAGGCDCNFS